VIERTDTSIRVQVEAAVSAADLFAVLADPSRHPEIDGSGMVRAAAGARPLTGTDQVFTMQMHYPALGDYRTENHVVEFDPPRRITWTTGREGQPPAGVWWTWNFSDAPSGATIVTHTYDWSRVVDPAVLARVSFPRVRAEQLADTAARLIAAAG
jgi:uncharacterized protein YndB with AHSA1/START domain